MVPPRRPSEARGEDDLPADDVFLFPGKSRFSRCSCTLRKPVTRIITLSSRSATSRESFAQRGWIGPYEFKAVALRMNRYLIQPPRLHERERLPPRFRGNFYIAANCSRLPLTRARKRSHTFIYVSRRLLFN